jgi:hypothetical protein
VRFRIFLIAFARTHPADASLGDLLFAFGGKKVIKKSNPLSAEGEERVNERSDVRVSKRRAFITATINPPKFSYIATKPILFSLFIKPDKKRESDIIKIAIAL